MRRPAAAVLFGCTVLLASAVSVTPAGATVTATDTAATGEVLVFSDELHELQVYRNPTGCYGLPLGAHLLLNDTNRTVSVYTDPLCLLPAHPLSSADPGHGVHVSPIGSFRARR